MCRTFGSITDCLDPQTVSYCHYFTIIVVVMIITSGRNINLMSSCSSSLTSVSVFPTIFDMGVGVGVGG